MSSEDGTTTVTHVAASAAGPPPQPLFLVWRFPRAAVPVCLDWQGEGELSVGRDASCAVQLDGHDVSRRHAVLRKTGIGAGASIADLGSRNGVQVNGRRVAVAQLHPQDVVRIGGWVGIVTAPPGDFEEIAPGLWGSATIRSALAPLRRAATSNLPIILEGETGTGKEVFAGALHRWSERRGPLVAVNCAALPEALAEGELFGYRRGAFTGADRPSPGFFRAAEGGTLLLDEISDLPLALQAKLLRVLEQREVQPLGESRTVPIDVRVVVAGQQSLLASVQAGRFRADLLARLDGLTVKLPPLRERREDVLPLFSHLIAKAGSGQALAFESDFAERLCAHDWPFNVREIVLLSRRILALHGTGTTLRAQHFPDRIDPHAEARTGAPSGTPASATPAGDRVELPALLAALRASRGNVVRAAAILGISRGRAYRLMEGQPVDLEEMRQPEQKPR